MTHAKGTTILRRKEDRFLLVYQVVLTALLLATAAAWNMVPTAINIVFVWCALVLTTKYENIVHCAIHYPVFQNKSLNRLHRLSLCVVPPPAVWYRVEHFRHHRFNNRLADETSTLEPRGRTHQTPITYILAVFTEPSYYLRLWRAMRPAERREGLVSLFFSLLTTMCLAFINLRATLCFWIPVVWIGSFVMMSLYDYLDHVPGDPENEFRYATYAHPKNWFERLIARLDMYNRATHLTHHRSPKIHWADVLAVQEQWLGRYEKEESPRSLAPMLDIINPIGFLRALARVHHQRNV